MTGLKVVEVNAKIEDVLSPDEFRDRLNGYRAERAVVLMYGCFLNK